MDYCKSCGKNRPIVNKRYELCTECNRKRMYGEDYKERFTRINPISKKEAINRKNKHNIYTKKDSDIDNLYCKGCGNTSALTHSHLVPVSKDKSLESNPLNITEHCLKCHADFESNDFLRMSKMKDFKENMDKIKKLNYFHHTMLMQKFVNQGYGKELVETFKDFMIIFSSNHGVQQS